MASRRLRRGRDRGSIASSSSSSSSILEPPPPLRRRRSAFVTAAAAALLVIVGCLPCGGATTTATTGTTSPTPPSLLRPFASSSSPPSSPAFLTTARRRRDAVLRKTTTTASLSPRERRAGGACCADVFSPYYSVGGPTTTSSSTAMRQSSLSDEQEKEEAKKEEEAGFGVGGGIYRPYASYAWDRMSESSGLFDSDTGAAEVPEDLRGNSSPAKGPNLEEGTTVEIEIESAEGSTNSPVRLARYALLETLAPESACVPDAIHVLNLVVFPSPDLCLVVASADGNSEVKEEEEKEEEEGEELALPVLGIDLVTLPGGKHLVAIDLQPVLPPPPPPNVEGKEAEKGKGRRLLHPRYSHYEDKLATLHDTYCGTGSTGDPSSSEPLLPWGGDVPPAAARYFSPYAVWTRLSGQEGLERVTKGGVVWDVFRKYLELYLELMGRVRKDLEAGTVAAVRPPPSSSRGEDGSVEKKDDGVEDDDTEDDGSKGEDDEGALEGQRSYLNYRRVNDPARPMLRRLYGEEWTERLIEEVLFRDV